MTPIFKGFPVTLLGALASSAIFFAVTSCERSTEEQADAKTADTRSPKDGETRGKAISGQVRQFKLGLPTENRLIFSDPKNYYMYTDRNFEGVSSKPWQGGQYGFTRNQKRTPIGVIYTRLHEGIDVRPVRRNSKGDPLDDVYSISDGKVAYVNTSATASSYGKYVVVQHDWPEGPFFSLYAHLAWPSVSVGKKIKAGDAVGRLGYTGRGINQERAHVHVELNFMLSQRFMTWYGKHFSSKNNHGIHNGFNLTGMDIARFYRERAANPTVTVQDFMSREPAYYTVKCPTPKGMPGILKRHPWMIKPGTVTPENAKSWEFTFAQSGVPISAKPTGDSLKYPSVIWVKTMNTNHSYLTVGRLEGWGSKASLSSSGSRYIQLITDNF